MFTTCTPHTRMRSYLDKYPGKSLQNRKKKQPNFTESHIRLAVDYGIINEKRNIPAPTMPIAKIELAQTSWSLS